MEQVHKLSFYTDGSCSTASREGGWGFVFVDHDIEKVSFDYGAASDTTNNRMELTAFLNALIKIEHIIPFSKDTYEITVFSDSAYIVNCLLQKWYKKWLLNGWHTSNRMPVKNKDLWQEIIHSYERIEKDKSLKLTIEKVKGHSADKYNDLADECANKWRLRLK